MIFAYSVRLDYAPVLGIISKDLDIEYDVCYLRNGSRETFQVLLWVPVRQIRWRQQEPDNMADLNSGLQPPGDSSGTPTAGDNEADEQNFNLALLEPPSFGWSAAGGISDLRPPYEFTQTKENVGRSDAKRKAWTIDQAMSMGSADANKEHETSSAAPKVAEEPAQLSALTDDDTHMDTLTYCYGRQDQKPSDCFSMKAQVLVEFPLGDGFFQESVQWDLGSSETKSPFEYATSVAQEFDLSYAQTWDIADGIQRQLQQFVRVNFSYAPPVAQGVEKPGNVTHNLYGTMLGGGEGGHALRKKNPSNMLRSSSFRSHLGKRRNSLDVVAEKPEDVYYTVVRGRLIAACKADVKVSRATSCHICRQACVSLCCEEAGHGYCKRHYAEKVPDGCVEYCPFCSFDCRCEQCSTRLDHMAVDFKRRCKEQQCIPADTQFPDILEYSRASWRRRGMRKKRKSVEPKKVVEKLPRNEFPREVTNGVDADYEYAEFYQTIFTSRGAAVITEVKDAVKEPPRHQPPAEVPIEDGSVDFCNVCRKVGNIFCCDYCPRAFHKECIPGFDLGDEGDDSKWECPSCVKDKTPQPEDKLFADESFAKVRKVYGTADLDCDELRTVAILLQMLQLLIVYDFGYMFRAPVDCKAIPSYKTIVKHPMDLGTIGNNILEGKYKQTIDKFTLEKLVIAVLKDIELVWHNCYIFNVEGSAVYRMAEVQKRRADNIKKASYEHLLSPTVKSAVQSYITILEEERRIYKSMEAKAKIVAKSKARHKISGSRHNGKTRPVAVLDPETGTLAKIYCTMQSACNAVCYLINQKKECEWDADDIDSTGKLRAVILRCTEEPETLLYGYRWVFLDDLQRRRVKFAKGRKGGARPKPLVEREFIHMMAGKVSYFFATIEEALSIPGLPIELSEMRRILQQLVPGADFIDAAYMKWRRLDPNQLREHSHDVMVEPGISAQRISNISQLPEVTIVKEDTIAGDCMLLGFATEEDAFIDWSECMDASIVSQSATKTMEAFRTYYLDGARHVDGLRWRKLKASLKVYAPSAPVASAKTDSPLPYPSPKEPDSRDRKSVV